MSRSNWLYVIAVGGLIASSALAQVPLQQPEGHQPPAEEADTNGETGPAEHQNESTNESQEAITTLPEPGAVVSSPVDAIASDNEATEGNRYPDCEFDNVAECDLAAQQGMAESTRYMNYAAWVGVFLTGIALLLIWRTLVYTRRAAQAAVDTVEEARAATAAAVATVKESERATFAALKTAGEAKRSAQASIRGAQEAKRSADFAEDSFKRLERPYLFIEIVSQDRLFNPGDLKPAITYKLTNYGKTPAVFSSIFLELCDISQIQFMPPGKPRVPAGVPRESWYETLAQGGSTGQRHVEVAGSEYGQRSYARAPLSLHGVLHYQDPMQAFYSYHFVLTRKDGRFCLEYEDESVRYPEDREPPKFQKESEPPPDDHSP